MNVRITTATQDNHPDTCTCGLCNTWFFVDRATKRFEQDVEEVVHLLEWKRRRYRVLLRERSLEDRKPQEPTVIVEPRCTWFRRATLRSSAKGIKNWHKRA